VLQVTAVDPDGTALTFAWENPLVGTLGTPSNTADTSEVVWTAPSSFGAAVEVRVTITDGTGIRQASSSASRRRCPNGSS